MPLKRIAWDSIPAIRPTASEICETLRNVLVSLGNEVSSFPEAESRPSLLNQLSPCQSTSGSAPQHHISLEGSAQSETTTQSFSSQSVSFVEPFSPHLSVSQSFPPPVSTFAARAEHGSFPQSSSGKRNLRVINALKQTTQKQSIL